MTTNYIALNDLDLTFVYPDEIPINIKSAKGFIDRIIAMDVIPFNKGNIRFSDQRWDFTEYTQLNVGKTNLCFYFDKINPCYLKIAKSFVLLRLLENTVKIQTVHNELQIARIFLNFLSEKRFVYDFNAICASDIDEFFKLFKYNAITDIARKKIKLFNFINTITGNFNITLPKTVYESLEIKNTSALAAYKEAHKSDIIPSDYLAKFISVMIKCVNNESMNEDYRALACVYVILSQTGLRISELLALKVDAMKTRIVDNEEISFLVYKTWKREKGNNKYSDIITSINPLTALAFKNLVRIQYDRRKELKRDLLYVGTNRMKVKSLPVSASSFLKISETFFIAIDNMGLLETINLPDDKWPSISRKKAQKKRAKSIRLGEATKTVAFPTTQQFRFNVVTDLIDNGVSEEYVQKFMGHLSSYMTTYHYLDKRNHQKESEEAAKILEGIISGKATPINDLKGLTGKINHFIEKDHLNVDDDMDTIIEKFKDRIPIRPKTGGVCIKSSSSRRNRACGYDSKTNEYYCAYGVCPNLYSFYYNLDITYQKYNDLLKSIEHNRNAGHKIEVKKQQKMIINVVNRKLLPQIRDLEKQITENGRDEICASHPKLLPIIDNLNEIKQEVKKWR